MEEIWNGYRHQWIPFEGHDGRIVLPKEGTENGYFAIKTAYFGAFPQALEIPLLEKGFHICHINNDNRFGTDADLDRDARFIRHVQAEFGLKNKCVPIGMSCGGLIAIKLAAKYPELISCLYLDAPVINYMSWPCGFGIGGLKRSDKFSEILKALELKDISQLLAYRDMPLDVLPKLIENKIPIVMSSGDSDQHVPYCENGIFVEQAYKDAGVEIEVYIKPGGDHHPHGLPDPKVLVDFVLRHCD